MKLDIIAILFELLLEKRKIKQNSLTKDCENYLMILIKTKILIKKMILKSKRC